MNTELNSSKPFGGLSNAQIMYVINSMNEKKIYFDHLNNSLHLSESGKLQIPIPQEIIDRQKDRYAEHSKMLNEIEAILKPYKELISEAEPDLAHMGYCMCSECQKLRKNKGDGNDDLDGPEFGSGDHKPDNPVGSLGGFGATFGEKKDRKPSEKQASKTDIDKINF